MTTKTISMISLILTICVVLAMLGGCLAQPMESVPEPLLGTWHGESKVRLPIVFEPEPDNDPGDDVKVPLMLELTIHEDGTVMGMVGNAELKGCVLKKNRGELGRRLNVASDYVIMDGYLDDSIVDEDTILQKDLSIPFDIVDGHIQGTLLLAKRRTASAAADAAC